MITHKRHTISVLTLLRSTCFVISLSCALLLSGQLLREAPVQTEEADEDIRITPNLDVDAAVEEYLEEENIEVPSFVKKLPISMNGDDWTSLRKVLSDGGYAVNIVHIGDSHLQADIATNDVRELLQLEFGNAGRGLIAPFRLSGTNQPYNYSFSSNIDWAVQKFMKSWTHEMGVTGCSLYSAHPEGFVELSTSERYDYNPFSRITLLHSGDLCIEQVTDEEGISIGFTQQSVAEGTDLLLSAPKRMVRLSLNDCGSLTLFGAYLSNNRPGVIYNVIGNNGAAYSSYNRIDNFGKRLSALRPRLVILSLGTNEAFGSFNALTFITEVDNLIKDIKRRIPGVKILITTPGECQRRITTKVRRKGKRRRTTTQTSFVVNTNVAKVRSALLSYASREHIPVYDFYAAAGPSERWAEHGLFSKDRIHLSGRGYHVQGKMLFEALINQLK